jgi:hypothetical protein
MNKRHQAERQSNFAGEKRPITAAYRRIGKSKLPELWRKKFNLWPGATWFEAAATGLFRAAASGNPEAAREIFDAVYGKVPLRIELTGEGGGAIVLADLVKKIFEKIAA